MFHPQIVATTVTQPFASRRIDGQFDFFDEFDGQRAPRPGLYDTSCLDMARANECRCRCNRGRCSHSFGFTASRDSWANAPKWLSGPLKPERLTHSMANDALAFADSNRGS